VVELVDLLLDLLAVPSVTGDEAAIADLIAGRYHRRGEPVRRVAESLVVGDLADRRPLVLLVAHTDTVPPTDADRHPYQDGERVVGRGASDMKAGLAVAMRVFEDPTVRSGPVTLALVAYAGEEGSHDGNQLGRVLAEVPELSRAALGVVLEPTDLQVQLGCMGTIHAEVAFSGRAAHSARPWQGVNALTAAAPMLGALAGRPPADLTVDGLPFREVLVPTQAWTANARNVVPDRFLINVNYRYAPDKSPAEAEDALRAAVAIAAQPALASGGAPLPAGQDGARTDANPPGVAGVGVPAVPEVVVTDHAPAGRPARHDPFVAAFLAGARAQVGPKQAWTDVGRLSAAGIPALNHGPGLTAQAHQAGEHVPVANLAAGRAALTRALAALPGGRYT